MKNRIPIETQKQLLEWIDKEFKNFAPEKLAMAHTIWIVAVGMIENFLEMCINVKEEKLNEKI